MGSRHTAATVAALAAEALLGACSTDVQGEASPSRSVTMKAATVTSVPPVVTEPGPVGELQDVTGQGVVWRTGATGPRWAPSPEPGVEIGSRVGSCTLGPAIRKGGRSGFLVARHCDGKSGGAGQQFPRTNASGTDRPALPAITDVNEPTDSGVIWTEAAADDTKVAGTWPVRGALTLPQVQALNVSSKVCVNSAVSGVICGSVASASESTMFLILATREGDSGSEVFVVDERGDAWIAGVLVRGNSGKASDATPISAILGGLNATVIAA